MEPQDDEVRRLLDELEGVTLESRPDGVRLHAADIGVGGREKFSRRRKLCRLRRLVTQAERHGELSTFVGSRDPVIRVRVESDRATIVVDRRDVEVTVDDGAVGVCADGVEERHDLPFTPTSASRTVSNGIMTIELT